MNEMMIWHDTMVKKSCVFSHLCLLTWWFWCRLADAGDPSRYKVDGDEGIVSQLGRLHSFWPRNQPNCPKPKLLIQSDRFWKSTVFAQIVKTPAMTWSKRSLRPTMKAREWRTPFSKFVSCVFGFNFFLKRFVLFPLTVWSRTYLFASCHQNCCWNMRSGNHLKAG